MDVELILLIIGLVLAGPVIYFFAADSRVDEHHRR